MTWRLAVIGVLGSSLSSFACSKQTSSYFPLSEGRTWKYEAHDVSLVHGELTASVTVTNMRPRELKGRRTTPRKQIIETNGQTMTVLEYMVEDTTGVYSIAGQSGFDADPTIGQPKYLFQLPLKVGTTWSDPFTLQFVPGQARIEELNSVVDVPAGSFSNCLKVRVTPIPPPLANQRGSDAEALLWYAPSVGLVKVIQRRPIGKGRYSLQLVSFTR